MKYDKSDAEGDVPVPYYAPSGTEITAAEQGNLTKGDCTFNGWNTNTNGSGTAYAANDSFTLGEDTTLYAQWLVPVTYTKIEAKDASYTEAGNTEYYTGSDGKYYALENGGYKEITENSWIIPMLEKTEVTVITVDINGIKTSKTVYAETFANDGYSVSAAALDGYNFVGWKVNGTEYTTANTANAAVAELVHAKNDVTVEVVYEKKPDKFNVTVENGKLSTGKTSGEIQVSKLVTVKANAAPSGKTFSHWERNGKTVSASAAYSFYMPSENVELKAVYEDTATPAGTAIIESVTASSNKLSFVSVLNVPKNCKFVKGGLVATSNAAIGVNVDANNAAYVKLTTKATANTKNAKYTWTKSGVGSSIWYVKAYLVYKDASGKETTVYSDAVKADKNGEIRVK